ncbi:transcriptional regulator [Dyadobacter chenwenxiniae]|uniref:Transcriptional regulator n=1 Tax=Dyadobacter chenwenxiniae TaxID=2906456 RepID=A0A9X1PIK6_9BACT|nr:transcriptional regulator [Dyadobacter chenwenxiniae]MCF0053276.1 transcriptional regulator [Dyadobacter chenwenxiniae]MCF0060995.1 transcriptional regulator [Dyadobacter chenwenxiniae]UON80824.1 transcriptional regulator [Dyadobacter chenwenxiniae]
MEWLEKFNKVFESKIRLGLMSVLVVNDSLSFNELKELLQLTDGNLASHLKALEETKYIAFQKQFLGRKPLTTYKATDEGHKAFTDHLQVLENMIRENL